MSHIWKMTLVPLLVLVLLATLSFGCAKKAEEKATIVIGLLTDMTGPASSLLVVGESAYYDAVSYANEEDPIPGVVIKIISFDTKYDPARDIPGYYWLKERGAHIVYSGIPTVGDTLKEQAGRDKFPIVSSSPSQYQLEPPGWVLGLTPPVSWVMKGFLQWISEEHWDYQAEGRKPKIGAVGWEEPYHVDVTRAIREYCSEHEDEFDYIAGPIVPMGTVTWSGEIETLKDADYIYIPSTGLGTATFAKDYRDRGYTATFIGLDAMGAFLHLLEEKAGWDYLDGSLTAHTTLYWTDQFPIVDRCKELLSRYHPGEEEDIIRNGLGYISMYFCMEFVVDMLRQAVEEVGIENFDGQAFYDAALKFSWTDEGLPERGYGFSENIRYARKDLTVYEWRADVQDLMRISGWLPGDVPNP
jgi:hypothetical protein